MTYAELEKAFSMKLRGFTYSEIGRAMNYDYGTVRLALKSVVDGKNRRKDPPCIFPKIARYIRINAENRISVFADMLGVSESQTREILAGRHEVTPKFRKAVSKATGMGIAEAFSPYPIEPKAPEPPKLLRENQLRRSGGHGIYFGGISRDGGG